MVTAYLYKIVNTVNEKVYIGVTKSPKSRWSSHTSEKSTCTHLKRAIQKHGVDKFKMVLLCQGPPDYICEVESSAIIAYDSQQNGYNILSGHHSKGLNTPKYVTDKISKGLRTFYDNNDSPLLGRKYDNLPSDVPFYTLGFWFPNMRSAVSALGLTEVTIKRRIGYENGGQFKGFKKKPIYVGGFWFPSARVAADSLKLEIATVFARVGYGFVEQASSARSDAKLGEKNPMFGKVSHQCRRVSVEGIEFPSLKVATQNTRFTKSMLEKRLKKGVEGFHYVL